ncbi:MAG: hypothetical protein JWO89_853, partial [Verrucomicrobiaceae bacterium]|nr:hypothetical protein [Verrucomicrobiaceae bacterium]
FPPQFELYLGGLARQPFVEGRQIVFSPAKQGWVLFQASYKGKGKIAGASSVQLLSNHRRFGIEWPYQSTTDED